MSWRDQLRPASFRGVAFLVDADKSPAGRRTVLHEYPQRDTPYVEDMGRRTRQFSLTAFVIGPDCLDKRDALLKALETAGPGELVHPWYGTLKVVAGDSDVSHAHAEGGVVRFELSFTEAGELAYPTGQINTSQRVASAGDKVLSSGLSRFTTAVAQINRAKITEAVMGRVSGEIFGAMQTYCRPLADQIGSAQALAGLVVSGPAQLRTLVSNVMDAGGAFHAFDGYRDALGGITGRIGAASTLAAVPAPVGQEATRLQTAMVNLFQDVLVADAVREVSEMPVSQPAQALPAMPALSVQVQQPVARPEVPVVDDVREIQAVVTTALWDRAQTAPHDYYEAATDARIQIGRHLAAVARQGVRLTTVTPPEPVPALVLAYARYGDAGRADEVVSRNRIAHPSFLPAAPLQVAMT